MEGLNYWEKLQEMELYSQERGLELYQVIFLWKISQGLVKGYDVNFQSEYGRRGRKIVPNTIVKTAPALVKNARERTMAVRGAQIFNLLPDNVRNMNSDHIDYFKNHLDIFLSTVPDQPTVPGYARGASTNSLSDQIPFYENSF